MIPVVSILMGFFQAYSESLRVEFIYVNKCFPYERLSGPFSPTNCLPTSISPCSYRSPVNLGASVSEAALIAAGAIASPAKGCYIN